MSIKNLFSFIVIAAILFLISSTSHSQLLNIGAKGGMTASSISGYTTDTDTKIGFAAYLFADVVNLPVVSISGEVGYVQKGFNLPVLTTNSKGQPTGTYIDKANLDYVNISIIGKFKVSKSKKAIPYLLIGPTLGMKASSSMTSEGTGGNTVDAELEQMLKDFKSSAFGSTLGIGLEVPAAKTLNVLAEARFNIDFTNSYENANMSLKNKGFEFLIGVKF